MQFKVSEKGVRAADGRWPPSFWGRNLFDKSCFVGVGTVNAVSPSIGLPGDPRSNRVAAKVSF